VRKKAVALIFGVMAVGLLAVGCGGGDDEPAPIAKKSFYKQANDICWDTSYEKLNPELGKLIRKTAKSNEQQTKDIEAEYVADVLVPNVQTEVDELRALGMPRGDEPKIEAFLDEVQEVMEKAEESPEDYPSKVSLSKASSKAESIGVQECPIG
jgi:molecular chaperone DnaK (HSP70)